MIHDTREQPPQQIPRPNRHSASEAREIIENIPACVCYLCSVAQWPPIDRLQSRRMISVTLVTLPQASSQMMTPVPAIG